MLSSIKILKSIYSMKPYFTFNELCVQVNDVINSASLKRYLSKLCENEILIKHGSLYFIDENQIRDKRD